jgi:Zn-dependent protease
MTIHEFAHNYVAYRMGDPNPAREGRLTLNPMVHIHPLGFIMGVLIGFGILGSAPISPYRMRNPRWGYMWAVAAGPISNLLLAAVFAIPIRLAPLTFLDMGIVTTILLQIIFLNVVLALFNIIPLFPLDGWSITLALLPPDLAVWWQRNQQNSQYVFFGLIFLSFAAQGGPFDILGKLINGPSLSIIQFILGPQASQLLFFGR